MKWKKIKCTAKWEMPWN